MANRKQQLIHLHSTTPLTVERANAVGVSMAVGEIAVQAAADKENSSLWILTSDKANVVQFPSVEKVTSMITDATGKDISGLQTSVSDLQITLTGYDKEHKVADAISAATNSLQGQINGIASQIGSGFSTESTIADQLSAVKTTADDANKQATTNKNSIDTINSVLKGLSGESAVSNAINKAKTKVVRNADTATTKFLTVTDNSAASPSSGVTYTLTLTDVASAKGLSDLSTKVGTNETDITALKALHANKTDKSGKMSVKEEVAAGIAEVVAGAPADFDTLKEIADWIANDKTSSAQMVNDIAGLKAALNGYTSNDAVQNAFTTVNNNINAINDKIGDGFDSANTVAKKVAAAKTTITTANTGLILISSSTDSGDSHVNYTISANGIASDSDLSALSTKVTTLQGNLNNEITNRTDGDSEIKGLIGTGFTSTETVAKKVAAAKTKVARSTDTATTKFLAVSDNSADSPADGVTYTLTLTDVASANDLSTLKSAAAKSGKITVDRQEFKATSVDATNSLNFDLSNLVIDCGEY